MLLDELGPRICVMGPSNSGKSTLASAIGRARDLPIIHLDQLRHVPGSQWELRSDSDFAELHDAATLGNRWVIDGNYTALLPSRLARATGLVLLDASLGSSLFRYFRRTLGARERVGGLGTTHDTVSWEMLRFMMGAGQAGRHRSRELFDDLSVPKVFIPGMRALKTFYREELLEF